MDEKYISEPETEAEKKRLISLFTKALQKAGLLDLTGFIKEKAKIHDNHTHPGFVKSVAYKIEADGFGEVIPLEDWKRFLVKLIVWRKRHPYLHALFLTIISSLFSVLVGLTVALTALSIKDINQKKIDSIQNTTINNLRDSVDKIQVDLIELKNALKRKK